MKLFALLTLAAACLLLPTGAKAADETFDSNGVRIRYVTAGEGEAVVLIHGWMSDATMWGKDSSGNPKLNTTGAEGFQLIALDCRGHGQSEKLYDPRKYGVEMAEDVVRLLDHLKVKKAHLIGYSMGAFIAGNIAARHPDRVLSVIYGGQAPLLVGTPAGGSDEVEAFAKAVEDGKGLGPYLIAVTPSDRPKLTPEFANTMANYLFKGKDVRALAVAGRSLGELRVNPKDLQKCTAPAIFIYGGNESSVVKDAVAAARKVLVNSEVKVIEGGDHISTLIKPAFGATIMAFLHAHRSKP